LAEVFARTDPDGSDRSLATSAFVNRGGMGFFVLISLPGYKAIGAGCHRNPATQARLVLYHANQRLCFAGG
jgi:hypothetical protein